MCKISCIHFKEENINGKFNLTITKDDQIIVYYYSGRRSAQTTFVLTKLLDYNNVKKNDGAWTE